jgi:type III secretion protein Q
MSLAEALPTVEEWPPRIAPEDVAAINALHRRRGAAEFMLAGRRARFALRPNEEPPLVDGPAFRVTFGGVQAVVRAPRELVGELLRPLGPNIRIDELDPAAAALLLEFAIVEDIARLEGALGHEVSVLERQDATFILRAHEAAARLELDGRAHELRLWLERDAMARLGSALDRLSKTADPVDLAQTVRICMGWRELPVAALRDLARGDVVILESGRGMSGPVATVGDRLAARLTADGGRLVAASRFAPLGGTNWEWTMDSTTEAPKRLENLDEGEIDQLPVKLVFELGRAEMSLGEVKRVAQGSVIPLSRSLDEAVDIVANGRRIGQGSIVRIGDAIGVRVERLAANG